MTTIFISGSREIPFIPEEARERIDRIVDRGFDIVVGDSEKGVDAKVIGYLSSCGYSRVSVYTIHDKPRVEAMPNSWRICKVVPEAEKKVGSSGGVRNARELETAKDRAMGEVADYGLVIWKSSFTNRFGKESSSKGSLRNMHQLLSAGKPVVLFMYEGNDHDGAGFSCLELRSLDDLDRVVAGCSDVVVKSYETIVARAVKSQIAQGTLFT